MKKNIQMIVTRKYQKDDIEVGDIITDKILNNEFKYIHIPIKYLFDYIQDIYINIHIYVIFIFIIILIFIFFRSNFLNFPNFLKINNT